MNWADIVMEKLKANRLEMICHVPDSVLSHIISETEIDPFFTVVPLTREEEGVAAKVLVNLMYMKTATSLASPTLGCRI